MKYNELKDGEYVQFSDGGKDKFFNESFRILKNRVDPFEAKSNFYKVVKGVPVNSKCGKLPYTNSDFEYEKCFFNPSEELDVGEKFYLLDRITLKLCEYLGRKSDTYTAIAFPSLGYILVLKRDNIEIPHEACNISVFIEDFADIEFKSVGKETNRDKLISYIDEIEEMLDCNSLKLNSLRFAEDYIEEHDEKEILPLSLELYEDKEDLVSHLHNSISDNIYDYDGWDEF